MIDPAYAQTLALYNQWQNRSIFGASAQLDDDARRADLGAFFRSIHATLNHLLFADRLWMSRFVGQPRPDGAFPGVDLIAEWEKLHAARGDLDAAILAWAKRLSPEALSDDLVWRSGLRETEVRKPLWLAITHFFNHQTHHRGQVHALLTAAGAKPLDTDLIFMANLAP